MAMSIRKQCLTAAPSPDGLPSETDIARKLAHLLPPQVKDKFLCDKPLEIRPVEFHNPMKGHIAEPVRQVWLRANGAVPDDLRIHQYLLGYASDFNFLPVALQPHGVGFLEPGMQVATIDHSMWFHLNRLILMNGCFIASKAPRPPAPAASFAANSTPRMARWLPQRFRKG